MPGPAATRIFPTIAPFEVLSCVSELLRKKPPRKAKNTK